VRREEGGGGGRRRWSDCSCDYDDDHHHPSYHPCILPLLSSPLFLSNANLPVMVWIHGGSFEYGASSEFMYQSEGELGKKGVVVVTVNYRLGE